MEPFIVYLSLTKRILENLSFLKKKKILIVEKQMILSCTTKIFIIEQVYHRKPLFGYPLSILTVELHSLYVKKLLCFSNTNLKKSFFLELVRDSNFLLKNATRTRGVDRTESLKFDLIISIVQFLKEQNNCKTFEASIWTRLSIRSSSTTDY